MKRLFKLLLLSLAGFLLIWFYVHSGLTKNQPKAKAETSSQPDVRKWQEYSYPEEGFAVDFPSEPKVTLDEDSAVKVARSYDVHDGDVVLTVSTDDHPHADAPDKATAAAMLIASIETPRLLMKGRMVSKQSVFIGDNEGIRFEIEGSKNERISGLVVLVGTKFYQVLVVRGMNVEYPAERFLDSFRLVS